MTKPKKNKSLEVSRVCSGVDHKEVRGLLSQIGDKWTVSIIGVLATHPKKKARFSEIERAVEGISQRMLTTTLKNLERDGIVVRELFPEVPPRVEYHLSSLGISLVSPIREIISWVSNNFAEVERAREKFDRRLEIRKKSIS